MRWRERKWGENETNEGDGELHGQREIITSSGSLTNAAVARHPALGSQWCHCPSFTCWQRLCGPLWSSPLTRDGCCTKAAQISMATSPASFSSLLHRTWTSSFVPAVSVFLLFLPDQENWRDKYPFNRSCSWPANMTKRPAFAFFWKIFLPSCHVPG